MSKWDPRDFARNFRDYDAPLATKIRLAIANSLRKGASHSGCCGHPGEPGC